MLGAAHFAGTRPRPGPPRRWGSMSDLLSRIATDRGDEAFRSLFDEYRPRVRRYMMQQGVDANLADELVRRGHELLEASYSWDAIAARTVNVYDELLNDR